MILQDADCGGASSKTKSQFKLFGRRAVSLLNLYGCPIAVVGGIGVRFVHFERDLMPAFVRAGKGEGKRNLPIGGQRQDGAPLDRQGLASGGKGRIGS